MATNALEFYVKLPTGKTLTLNLLPSDKIQDVLQKAADDLELPTSQVQVKYTGKTLNPTHTLSYLGVCKETILKIEVISIKPVSIFVKLPDGKTVPLTINNTSTLQEIKARVEAAETIDVGLQILKAGRVVLVGENKTALELGIGNEDVLQLSLKERSGSRSESRSRSSSCSSLGSDTGSRAGDRKSKKKKGKAAKQAEPNDKNIDELIGTFAPAGKAVEVVFCFDTTGSMYSCLEQVREQLRKTTERLLRDIPNIRIGIMAVGDYCDYNTYVIKSIDLTSDVDSLVSFVRTVEKTGGGDSPEAYEWALRKAQQLDWAEESAKAFVLIADDAPHAPSYTDQSVNWHEELDVLIGMGVKVYGVKAGATMNAVPFYEELAERSGGAYIKFWQFSLIKDMFLAVCYQESNPEQLQAFCAEVEEEGRMTSEVKDMMAQIAKVEDVKVKPPKQEPKKKRYVNAPWWDPKKDNGTPGYTYDQQTDKWKPLKGAVTRAASLGESMGSSIGSLASIDSSPGVGCTSARRSIKGAIRRKKGRKCSIM